MMSQKIITTKPLNQNKMKQEKYFIIEVGEDINNSIVFDITDKLKEQGHFFVVNCTSNINKFDVSRVSREEFNQFNGYEQSKQG